MIKQHLSAKEASAGYGNFRTKPTASIRDDIKYCKDCISGRKKSPINISNEWYRHLCSTSIQELNRRGYKL